eukprot:maker-scaffold_12-snap-gene-12.12-mRNA-1 protein AED:0.03 eAED:0.03 QI:88/1/1/1/1/1/5/134/209
MKQNKRSNSNNVFYCENEIIQIIPQFNSDKIRFIQGEFGPFRVQVPVEVPLWLAIYLKKKNKCSIKAPEWFSLENLKIMKEREKNSGISELQPIPFYYKEIAHLLLNYAGSDIQDAFEIKSAIFDISDIRDNKIRNSLGKIASEQSATNLIKFLTLKNAAAFELEKLRSDLLLPLREFSKLVEKSQEAAGVGLDVKQEDEEEHAMDSEG